MGNGLKVAVVGASGIGRHHANWHHLCGSDVVAFVGSSAERCESTAASLNRLFGFSGRGYTSMAALLAKEEVDIVDVCSPNHLHHDGALAALRAGCHVLCEKPLVWQEPADTEVLMAQGRELVDTAAAHRRHLSICTQYAAGLPHYHRLCPRTSDGDSGITSFSAEMETLSRGRDRSARDIWVDMGSHPLSLLLAWIPDGELVGDAPTVTMEGREARAIFDFGAGDCRCRVDIAVRDRPEGSPARRFGVNGDVVDCGGRAGADGVYRSVLSLGEEAEEGEDFMHLLIRQFTAVVLGDEDDPILPGSTGLRNLELQLELLAAARPA